MTVDETAAQTLDVGEGPTTRQRRFPHAGEAVFAVLVGLGLSLAFNWEIVRHPKTAIMSGIGDPLLQAWQLSWSQHLFSNFSTFWTGNIFYPAPQNFAFSDSLLGYLPLSFLFGDDQYGAVLRYNVAFIFACALAFIGAYLLTRQLGGNWQAALLAGIVFAWSPWRTMHNAHLNILSTGGIALALFAISRGHGYSLRHGRRPELTRPGWALAGWLIAAWQVTIGFATGIPFIYLMGGVGIAVVIVNIRRRTELPRRLFVFNGIGIAVFVAVTVLMVIPYLRVESIYHFTRSATEVKFYSPPLIGLFLTGYQPWLWRNTAFEGLQHLPTAAVGEQAVFPGLVILVFAVVGLFVSAWPRRVRVVLGVATALMTILTLGTTFFGGTFTYLLLWQYLPGWDAIRTSGRLILWVILLLVVLGAGAVTRLTELLAKRLPRSRIAALALVVPALAALLEGVPIQTWDPVPGIPPDLARLFAQHPQPMLILPEAGRDDFLYMLWSVDGFPSIANGNSGNFPQSFNDIIAGTTNFPDQAGVAVLERYHINTVVVLKVAAQSTPYAAALNRPLTGLPVTRTETNDLVVFTIHP